MKYLAAQLSQGRPPAALLASEVPNVIGNALKVSVQVVTLPGAVPCTAWGLSLTSVHQAIWPGSLTGSMHHEVAVKLPSLPPLLPVLDPEFLLELWSFLCTCQGESNLFD